MVIKETGTFNTPNASKYLQQLCKHFAHKVEVEYDNLQGKAALPPGEALLTANDEMLSVEISAEDSNGLARSRFIIDDHIKRFAFRENCEGMEWASN